MSNPFKKRATEFFVNDESFLSAITPMPINVFFERNRDRLYDRLVIISGTPGSGKTTLARLFQYRTIKVVLNHFDLDLYRDIAAALADCGMLQHGSPATLTCRIPLTSEYRDFWEFPYPEEVRTRLLESMLQARACLAWIQNLKDSGHSLNEVTIIPKRDSIAAAMKIGADGIDSLYDKARQTESAIYEISAALIPPELDQLSTTAKAPYRPFDVIERFEVASSSEVSRLHPLVIFDDAHELHTTQIEYLTSWLVRRELPISRWILTRLDTMSSKQVLHEFPNRTTEDLNRVQTKRDITMIRFQGGQERFTERKHFQKMARDMSNRYIRSMQLFDQNGITSLESILNTDAPMLADGDLKSLNDSFEKNRKRIQLSEHWYEQIKQNVTSFVKGTRDSDVGQDVQIAMKRILLHRYANRLSPSDLFSNHEDVEPGKPIKCNSGVAHGAQIQLMHQFGRPYYYGMSTLCDSGSNNAELFLQFADRFVEQVEIKILRKRNVSLSAREQHNLLRKRGSEIFESWSFPECNKVRCLLDLISSRCLPVTLKENAPLGAGANAYGILQSEFDQLSELHKRLAQVLQFAIAYNAIQLVPNYKTKGRVWCLIELGGAAILHYGLPFYRGGFVEGTVRELTGSLAS